MHAPNAVSTRLDAAAERRASVPWSVDRWGRLIAGVSVLAFTALALLHHPYWIAGTLFSAFNLVVTSLTDACPVRRVLMMLGAREREDLYLPGGTPRNHPHS